MCLLWQAVSLEVAKLLFGSQLSLGTQNALFLISVMVEYKEEYDCGPSKMYVIGCCLSHFSMAWQHHNLSNSRVHNSITFEFMTITLETMVVDRLARPWITPQWELTPQCRNSRQRELSGNYESFWNLKVSLNDTPPSTIPHLPALPK